MEWPGVRFKTNGIGQPILAVIIWFMLNDENLIKQIKHFHIQKTPISYGPTLVLYLYWHILRNFYVIITSFPRFKIGDLLGFIM